MNRYLAAGIGGLIATIPMTLFMAGGHRRLPSSDQYALPPREITDELLRRGGQPALSEASTARLSLAAHFAYGGVTGAMYPAMPGAERLARARPLAQALYGAGFGVTVWAGSYMGWIPALKVLGPSTAQPVSRRTLMIGAHLVWGAATVLAGERVAARAEVAPALSQTEQPTSA
ncbi:MAG: hypothetical protein CL583_15355 [Alteromonadaceae bacterium]|nr:hypothetical protein [Alteromonadaceae bacterium]